MMLVLTRREGEALLLLDEVTGDTTRVTVLEINGTTVKLGTDAPREVTILREELHTSDKEVVK
tara:strand:+ start:693 stop:881 length:189 start_codon:yes stop_codon:yes gene_type:complete